MKLAHKILLFAIAPILGGGLAISYKDSLTAQRLLLELKDDEARNELSHLEAYIRNFFESTVLDLRLLANQPVMQTGDVDAILKYLRDQYPRFSKRMESLAWNHVSGRVNDIHGIQLDVSQRYYWPQLLRGEFVISKALPHPLKQSPNVIIIAPVFRNNAVVGGVAAIVPIQELLHDLLSKHPERKGNIYLIDEDGQIFSKHTASMRRDEMLMFTSPTSSGIDRHIVEQQGDTAEPKLIDVAGVPTLVYYRPLPPTKWTLALAIQKDELTAPAEQIRRWDLIFFAVGVPLALILMIALNRVFLRPIRILMRAHRKVSSGDLSVAIEEGRDDELGELTQAFNQMVQSLGAAEKKREQTEKALQLAQRQAESAGDAKSHFIATMSHELRTPLQGISGASDLIDALSEDPEVRQYIRIVRQSSQNLGALINNILEISRLSAGKASIFVERFRPRDLLVGLQQDYQNRAKKKAIQILLEDCPEANQLFEGDRGKIRQILQFLLDNALKFTPQGTVSLSITVSPTKMDDKQTVCFSVQDTGIGIKDSDRAQIFTPFFQVESAYDRTYPGSGLGLTIAEKLADLISGHVRVASTLGAGSTFTLEVSLSTASEIGGEPA